MIKFDRKCYIPENATLEVAIDVIQSKELSGLQVYKYINKQNQLCAKCFIGRKVAPVWHYYFSDEQDYQSRVDLTIQNYERKKAYKAQWKIEQKENKKQSLALINEGDIFVRSYGYDCTLIEFYQVIKIKGQKVELVAIASEFVRNECGRNDYYNPVRNKIIDEKIYMATVSPYNTHNSIFLRCSAFRSGTIAKWDGQEVYQTNSYYI